PAETEPGVGGVDAQHLHLDLVADFDHLFRAFDLVVSQFRDVQEALESGLQLDEDAEVGELGDLALLEIAGVIAAGDVAFPRIVGHLLEAEGDALAVLIHVQDDALDLFALLHDVRGMGDLAHPAHVADVEQAVDTLFDLYESAVVGQVADDALDQRAGRIALGDFVPRVRLHLLDAERDFLLVLVDVEDLHFDLIADGDHLARMVDALGPAHLADVDKAFDARLELDERAVAHDVDDFARVLRTDRILLLDLFPRAGLL